MQRLLAVASQLDGSEDWCFAAAWKRWAVSLRRDADGDPNDVVAHEDRRDLRGARLLAAWLNHFDTREQNTMDVFVPLRADDEASAGHVRHYILDLGDCFGSVWNVDGISKRLGTAYYLDFGYVFEDFVTFGVIERPWTARSAPAGSSHYFSARDFVPRIGEVGLSQSRVHAHDRGGWSMDARILSHFDAPLVAAAVSVGQYDPESTRYLEATLLRAAGHLEALSDAPRRFSKLRIEAIALCGVDLARAHDFVTEGRSYTARAYWARTRTLRSASSRRQRWGGASASSFHGEGVATRHLRYFVVEIFNGLEGSLRAHLYDLGSQHGFRG